MLLADQDRSRWNRSQIDEGAVVAEHALRRSDRAPGPYALQAAIAACHATAATSADTDWTDIVALYDHLERLRPDPVVRLNHAVAVSQLQGPAAGLAIVDSIESLDGFHLFHAARADLLRRLDRRAEARCAYEAALALGPSEPERRFLSRRLGELDQLSDVTCATLTRPDGGAMVGPPEGEAP